MGGGVASGTASGAFFPSTSGGSGGQGVPGMASDGMSLGEAVAMSGIPRNSTCGEHQRIDQYEDDDVVDGILGGVSPGGIASSPPPETGLHGIDWGGGAEWDGFGATTFEESPVNLSPLRSGFAYGYVEEKPDGGARGASANDSEGASASGRGNAKPP